MESWFVRLYVIFCVLVLVGMAYAGRQGFFPVTSAATGAYVAPQ